MTDKSELPLVSVCMITYRHEMFIRQSIERILAQVVNFKIEFIISEDCSPDGTRAICEEYARKRPDIINLLPAEKNIGAMRNQFRALDACRGKYIAFCEGDDMWTDVYKLQKQVMALENRPDCTMCFAEALIQDDINGGVLETVPAHEKDIYTIEDVILAPQNFMPSATLVFRNGLLPNPIPAFLFDALSGDICLQLLLTNQGNALCLHEQMAIYRNHAGGISKSKFNVEHSERKLMELYANMDKYLDYKYTTTFRKRFYEEAKINLTYGSRDLKGLARIRHYFKNIGPYIKHADKINWKEFAYYHALIFAPWAIPGIKTKKQ